jgi:hypothetical protein
MQATATNYVIDRCSDRMANHKLAIPQLLLRIIKLFGQEIPIELLQGTYTHSAKTFTVWAPEAVSDFFKADDPSIPVQFKTGDAVMYKVIPSKLAPKTTGPNVEVGNNKCYISIGISIQPSP